MKICRAYLLASLLLVSVPTAISFKMIKMLLYFFSLLLSFPFFYSFFFILSFISFIHYSYFCSLFCLLLFCSLILFILIIDYQRSHYYRFFKKFFLTVYPYMNAVYEGLFFIYQLLYLYDKTKYYTPLLHLQRIAMKRLTLQDMV